MPYAKTRIGLDEGTLGLLLLCLGVGSIIAMPVAGALAARFGCRRVLTVGTLLICAALPLLAIVSSVPLLVVSLFLFGAGLGTVDSTVNLQAVIVERASGKTMMSGFHGLFSLGGIAGAAGVSALLGLGLSPLGAIGVVIVLLLLALLKAAPHLLPYGSESTGPAFAVPHGVVLFIGLLCFIVFLAEGAMLDWSAVFLSAERQVPDAYAGLGYAAFALTMTLGRLTGDAIVRRLGAKRVIVVGGITAAAGLALATLTPAWEATLVGYALVGAGCSNIVPVLYTAVGKHCRAGDHHPGLCGHSRRAGGDRFHCPCQQPEAGVSADCSDAGGRSDQRQDTAGLRHFWRAFARHDERRTCPRWGAQRPQNRPPRCNRYHSIAGQALSAITCASRSPQDRSVRGCPCGYFAGPVFPGATRTRAAQNSWPTASDGACRWCSHCPHGSGRHRTPGASGSGRWLPGTIRVAPLSEP